MVQAGSRAQKSSPVAVVAAFAVIGLGFVSAHDTADGSDLRPAGGDLASVVGDRARLAEQRQDDVATLQGEVENLTTSAAQRADMPDLTPMRADLGLTDVSGPGVRIVMSDAPKTRKTPDDANAANRMVVHQQDLQAVVNAMWIGGAEAVTVQGARIGPNTGIRCVGPTVLIDGVPYPAPYTIEAVGDPVRLFLALDQVSRIRNFRDDVKTSGVGFSFASVDKVVAPGYSGSTSLTSARVYTPS